MADLMTEVGRFREWAKAYPPDRSYGEWECDYQSWGSIYQAVFEFVDTHPFEEWSDDELRAVLYLIARDNEIEHIGREICRRHPELLLPLARGAIEQGERDNRWQMAKELGNHRQSGGEEEQLLLVLIQDGDEYVRRIALGALTHLGSPWVEKLALEAWHRPDDHQEHARMMVLECLHKIGSPHLEPLLAEAERDERQYLRGYAEGLRQRLTRLH